MIIKHISPSVYINLHTAMNSSSEDMILVLAPGTYTMGTNTLNYNHRIAVIGDPRNSRYLTRIDNNNADVDVYAKAGILFENVTFYWNYGGFDLREGYPTFNRVWFMWTGVYWYHRLYLYGGLNKVELRNSYFYHPPSWGNPRALFRKADNDIDYNIHRCTCSWIYPQMGSNLTPLGDFQQQASIVYDGSPTGPPSPDGAISLMSGASAIASSEAFPHLASNILDDTEGEYWEGEVGDFITVDLGGSFGVGEIHVKTDSNQTLSYDIHISEDLNTWHRMVGVSISSNEERVHDLYGYGVRYLRLTIMSSSSEKAHISLMEPFSTQQPQEWSERVAGYGPNSGYQYFKGPIAEETILSGSIKEAGLPTPENEIIVYSTNRRRIVTTVMSESDGSFQFRLPDLFLGNNLEIFCYLDNKKVHISSLIAPTKSCSSEFPQSCFEETLCDKVGGLWRNKFCWPAEEACEHPFYNCPDRTSCEDINGIWWDETKDCWSSTHNKLIDGTEKQINRTAALEMGGYVSGVAEEIHASNFEDYNDLLEGIDGEIPDPSKWRVRTFVGSPSATTCEIQGNKLLLSSTTIDDVITSTGLESTFLVNRWHGVFELSYSDVSLPTSTRFCFGIQSFYSTGHTNEDDKQKGAHIQGGINQFGRYYKNTSTINAVQSTAVGSWGRMRLVVTYQQMSVWLNVEDSGWVLIYNLSVTSPVMDDSSRLRFHINSYIAGTASIKLSDFKVLSATIWPGCIPGNDTVCRNSIACIDAGGYWDAETGGCCPTEPFVIDYAGIPDYANLNQHDIHLHGNQAPQGQVINESYHMHNYYDGVPTNDYWRNGGMTVTKLMDNDPLAPFDITLDFKLTQGNWGSYVNSTNYLPFLEITSYDEDKTNASWYHVMRVKLETVGASTARYAVEERTPWGYWSTSRAANIAWPTEGKLRLQREKYKGAVYGYQWDGSQWVRIHTKDVGHWITQGWNNLTYGVARIYIGSWCNSNGINNGTNWRFDALCEIDNMIIDGYHSPCGACDTHPIRTCVYEDDCENLGAYWQNTNSWISSDWNRVTRCSFIPPPDCTTDISLCEDETDCASGSHYWYNDTCNENPEPTCEDDYNLCLDEISCLNTGNYWYNDSCHNTLEATCLDTASFCLSQIACEDAGFYWNGSSCTSVDPCTGAYYYRCFSQESCEGLGYYWYDGICNGDRGHYEHGLETMGLRPSFYINFALDDPNKEVTTAGRVFTKNGSPSLMVGIESSGGSNYHYEFNPDGGSADNLITSEEIIIEDDFTIEMVINSSSFSTSQYTLDPFSIIGNNDTPSRYVSVSNTQVVVKTSEGEYALGLPSTRTVNSWYHIVLVRENGSAQVYMNGQAGQTLIMDGSLSLSRIASNAQGVFRGMIDEIVIYSYPFDSTQVSARSSYVISST